MRDEDPSPEDLDRFSEGEAYCPNCGAQVWDDVEVCPSCGEYIGGRTMRRSPVEQEFRQRWIVLVIVVLVVLLAGVLALLRLF